MEEVVLGGGGNKRLGGLEGLGPKFNGGDIVLHLCARCDIELEVVDELLELLQGTENMETF